MRGLISRIFGFVAAVKFPRFLQTFINEKYVSGFKIDMSEFKEPKEYESLTALFTRELQRPRNFDISPQAFISPSDGTCLERGVSKELKAISVKGHEYGIAELLGDSMERRERDAELEYVNIYLSPRDYHRYHAPCDMRILSALYVPGELYSV
uniref:phosphatidylserine decarboxylase n=1 Tax=uncultured Campylobacter sp. TaxID=218934 RepID=UPI0026367436